MDKKQDIYLQSMLITRKIIDQISELDNPVDARIAFPGLVQALAYFIYIMSLHSSKPEITQDNLVNGVCEILPEFVKELRKKHD